MEEKRINEITEEVKAAETREAILSRAEELALIYKRKGFHCSESAIRACSEALGLRIPEDVIRCASGFMGGGGNYGDRCGFLSSGCMIVSYLYGRMTPYQEIWRNNYLIRRLHERFCSETGAIHCRDILKKEINERGVEDQETCNNTFLKGARMITELLLDAEKLLSNIPDEERAIDCY